MTSSYREPIDYSDPRSILEANEDDAALRDRLAGGARDYAAEARQTALVFRWMLQPGNDDLPAIAVRAYCATFAGCPDVLAGISLDQIAALGQITVPQAEQLIDQAHSILSLDPRLIT